MGGDLTAIASSPQPMAHIIVNGLGQKGALILWSMVVLAQYAFFSPFITMVSILTLILRYMMGSSSVSSMNLTNIWNI